MSNEQLVHQKEYFPGTLSKWSREGNTCTLYCDNSVILRIEVLTSKIMRFRFSTWGYFHHDFSYAIDPKADLSFDQFEIKEKEKQIRIITPDITCVVEKQGLLTKMYDCKNKLILKDDKGFHWESNGEGGNIVQMSKTAHIDEVYLGLGDKTSHLNLRGERAENWVTDCFGYVTDSDPLYRAIPFYYGLNEGRAYGVFFDNSFRSYFDFAKERDDATSFWAHGGEMNYYFIYGPELTEVAEEYTLLTGRPELPPLWTLGFHQCKWSYFPEEQVKDIANSFREHKIPCDAIYLDIDYMDGYRCFTWNDEHFPDPQRMIKELKAQGFKTVVIIDAGIKIDPEYEIFTEGLEDDHFCRWPDGPFYQGKVWPGECYFPDFTQPKTREWWSGLFKDLIRKIEVDGVWNDMNEPAVFEVESKTFDPSIIHNYEGHPASHLKAHNVYGMQMSRASYEGMKAFGYPKRPFLITRATYSGGQRFASAWTGDNTASWEHLLLASTQSQRMSISGFSHIGSDIGGFNGVPDGELFARWVQMGIFHPLFRVHSIGFNDSGNEAVDEDAIEENKAGTVNRDQEPWSFGEPYTSVARKAIELRYQLIPYMYTAFWQYVKNGTPILRPLSFLDQHDPETLHRMEEFCLGDHILACPITEQGAEGRYLYLPKGNWYDFRTDQPIKGEQEIWTDTTLEDIPMYVRAGSVIPMAPVMQYTGEKPIEEMALHVYYKSGSEKSVLYTDAGDGYDYEEGKFLVNNFEVTGQEFSFKLSHRSEGDFVPSFDRFKIVFHALPYKSSQCLVDGEKMEVNFTDLTTEVVVPIDFKSLIIK